MQSHFYFISTSRPWYHLVAKNQGFSTSILLPWFRSTLGSAFLKLGFRHFEFKLISSSRQGYHLVAKNQGFQTSIYEWSLPSRVRSYVSFDERKTKYASFASTSTSPPVSARTRHLLHLSPANVCVCCTQFLPSTVIQTLQVNPSHLHVFQDALSLKQGDTLETRLYLKLGVFETRCGHN